MVRSYFTDGIPKASAELSYYLLFSIFPLLLVVSTLMSAMQVSQVTLLKILSLLPGDIQRIISPIITRYLGNVTPFVFIWRIFSFSILGIYFMSRTISSLVHTVNRIYNIPNRRGGIGQLIFEVLMAAGLIFAIVFSFVLWILGRSIRNFIARYMELPGQLQWIWSYGRFIIAIGLMFLFILILCYLCPNCIMRLKEALPGAIFTIIAWVICTVLFSFYTTNISQYDALYGSISAIMILMLWMYLTGIILILGFELNLILMKRKHKNFICKGRPWYARVLSGNTKKKHRKRRRIRRKVR
ncbi:MAG: YihY/virulence factor BrkB family protein [Eubacteriales bacterium]|nr:YihY/virulence factor BrkB family protein [Eubacteriales bacterium]